jgi:hypothetical protein
MDPTRTYDGWIGRDAYDLQGEKLGEIKALYYDDATNRPEWALVKTGTFGGSRLVPVHESVADGDNLRLGFDRDFIKNAPDVGDVDEHLDPAQEEQLWSYYGFDYTDRTTTGYGSRYTGERADRDFAYNRYDAERQDWGDEARVHDEVVAEATAVSEHAVVEAQPETVRLRKYRHVEMVPVTKEEVRVEKDVDPTTTTASRTTRTPR